jgi:hypothetical protein
LTEIATAADSSADKPPVQIAAAAIALAIAKNFVFIFVSRSSHHSPTHGMECATCNNAVKKSSQN